MQQERADVAVELVQRLRIACSVASDARGNPIREGVVAKVDRHSAPLPSRPDGVPTLGRLDVGVCAMRHTGAVTDDTAADAPRMRMMNRCAADEIEAAARRHSTYCQRMATPHATPGRPPTPGQSTVDILRSARIFAELPDDVLDRLAEACVRRTYRRNQYLWYQGDEGARLVIVASGLVKVVLGSENGDEVLLATLGPGETLGELALLDGAPRSASVVAVEPTTVLMLSRATVLGLLVHHPVRPRRAAALARRPGAAAHGADGRSRLPRPRRQAGQTAVAARGGPRRTHGTRGRGPRPVAVGPRVDGRRHPARREPRPAEHGRPGSDHDGRPRIVLRDVPALQRRAEA